MEDAQYRLSSPSVVRVLLIILFPGLILRFGVHRAILTILQIQAAASDPYTRYFALSSLICALMSLLYGCMYIVRFGTMRKTYKAAEWATVRIYSTT